MFKIMQKNIFASGTVYASKKLTNIIQELL